MAKKWTELQSQKKSETPQPPKGVRAKTAGQRRYERAIEEGAIILCSGPAGSGKTLLASSYAATSLFNQKFDKVILTRPMVTCGGGLGWLPGDVKEKFSPYLRPLLDALSELAGAEMVRKWLSEGCMEMWPLETMRGASLKKCLIILDEAQNATQAQIRMLLTRPGRGSKVIVTGDASQSDLPDGVNPFRQTIQRLRLAHPAIRLVELGPEDILRSNLVRIIEERLGPPRGESVLPQTWHDFDCPSCGAAGIYNNGDEEDLTAFDVESVQCWSCKNKWKLPDVDGPTDGRSPGEVCSPLPSSEECIDLTYPRLGRQ